MAFEHTKQVFLQYLHAATGNQHILCGSTLLHLIKAPPFLRLLRASPHCCSPLSVCLATRVAKEKTIRLNRRHTAVIRMGAAWAQDAS